MKRRGILSALSLCLLLSYPLPALAQEDTTPPQLVSISITPAFVDVSTSDTEVVVTATITDDLSGVAPTTKLCADGCLNAYDYFQNISGDTYEARIFIPQYSERWVFRDWYLLLEDQVGNEDRISEYELIERGINLAFGIGTIEQSYPRTISLHLGRRRASGYLSAEPYSNCDWAVPVALERRTRTGWRIVGSKLALYKASVDKGPSSFPSTARASIA